MAAPKALQHKHEYLESWLASGLEDHEVFPLGFLVQVLKHQQKKQGLCSRSNISVAGWFVCGDRISLCSPGWPGNG